jgi:hypothetical protein
MMKTEQDLNKSEDILYEGLHIVKVQYYSNWSTNPM